MASEEEKAENITYRGGAEGAEEIFLRAAEINIFFRKSRRRKLGERRRCCLFRLEGRNLEEYARQA